jgi:hypothetical protein
MGIPDLIRRNTEPEPVDLLNGPHKVCECGSPGCGCPVAPEPKYRSEA